jgi:AcrR family transcriptional regulator
MTEIPSRRDREKLLRESEIVNAAEMIFSKKGFEKASMDEIAKVSEFTKRTLYKYFINKEDLFFAVIKKCFEKLFTYMESGMKSGKTGYDKIKQGILAYYRFYKKHPDKFKLMNYIGFVKQEAKKSPNYKSFLEFDDFLFKKVMKIIGEGKADGSIRKDLDTTNLTYSIVFIITGFLYQLSITGKTFTEHFSLNEETFSLFTIELLTNIFKNNDSMK